MGSTFRLAAPFAPAGYQPGAIRELSEGLAHGIARQGETARTVAVRSRRRARPLA